MKLKHEVKHDGPPTFDTVKPVQDVLGTLFENGARFLSVGASGSTCLRDFFRGGSEVAEYVAREVDG